MKEYQIIVSNDKKNNAVSLELKGYLNTTSILEIKKDISKAIKDAKIINIKVLDVDDADLSFIQLMYSLRQKADESKIEFGIELDINQEVLELFRRSGFSDTFN